MNKFEKLLSKISDEVPVIEMNLIEETGLEAAYEDNYIYLDKDLPNNKKYVHLSEEYAHHKTSVGNILDYNDPESRKQEIVARKFSVERILSLDKFIECYEHGFTSIYECAEYLEVTEEVIYEALWHYHTKYGLYYYYKGRLFHFNEHSIYISDTKIS